MDTRFTSPRRSGTLSRARTGGDAVNTSGFSVPEDVDPLHSVSTYHDYPSTQPFIHDPYRRPADKPVHAYPESNRQAVMSALKGLQDKIRHLELERSHAEDNLKMLATETTRYHDILQQGPADQGFVPPHTTVSQDTQGNKTRPSPELPPSTSPTLHHQHTELESHLQAAENRSELLEKQLEYMRRMVHAAESDRSEAVRRSQALEAQRVKDSQYDFSETRRQEKLAELEREHIKLTASQGLAENKIRDLEDKLREERHHRKLMQERAAHMASTAESNRILMKTGNTAKKPKKKKVVTQKARTQLPTAESNGWSDHYRLNLADMPFVAGKSTGPSHSVPANVQKVLSMMKSHNNVLCPCSPRSMRAPPEKDTYDEYTANGHDSRVTNGYNSAATNGFLVNSAPRVSASHGPHSSRTDLASLLLQLQDEFGHLSYEHQELSSQIHEVTDPRLRDDLERELDYIVAKMETKGDQIATLRKHQEAKKKKKSKASKVRPASASATIPSAGDREVEVRTTIKTKTSRHRTPDTYARPTVSSAGKASLKFLKDLKKIQSTLQKDDLSWDC